MMNDDRNDTQYSCGTVASTVSNPTVADIRDESNTTILYVAGEFKYIAMQLTKWFKCVTETDFGGSN